MRVFVSSTAEDLTEHRAVARLSVLDMDWLPDMMEHATTSELVTVDACKSRLEQCDLVLLIVAFRRGWVPSVEQQGNGVDSITAIEFAHARLKNIPVLIFLASEQWPGKFWEESDDGRLWIRSFRQGLNQPAAFFEPELSGTKDSERLPTFRTKVKEALVSHQKRLLDGAPKTSSFPPVDFFEEARNGLCAGTAIPFVGRGTFSAGPLSDGSLLAAMLGPAITAQRVDRSEGLTLAAGSEYLQRIKDSRPGFLDAFRKILKEKSLRAATPSIYNVIAAGPPPGLIVSATYDTKLEEALAAHQPTVVVHVIRSADGKHDGKILVLAAGKPPELCVADKVDLQGLPCVIYKPLGTPFLPPELDELELDTLVITETDHLTFLGRLENQHTQIPTSLTRAFQKRPLLFIGYTLDVWHYRLVMQVFQAVGRRGKLGAIFAIRQSATPMESLAWTRLGASVIPTEIDAFVERLQNPVGAQ